MLTACPAASAADPQAEPRHRDHPEPGGGELAVEAPCVPEVQVPMELVDPAPQGQCAAGAVDGEVAADLPGRGVHEDRAGLALAEGVVGVHHARGVAGLRRRPHGGELRIRSDVGLGRLHLGGQRQRRGSGAAADEAFSSWA